MKCVSEKLTGRPQLSWPTNILNEAIFTQVLWQSLQMLHFRGRLLWWKRGKWASNSLMTVITWANTGLLQPQRVCKPLEVSRDNLCVVTGPSGCGSGPLGCLDDKTGQYDHLPVGMYTGHCRPVEESLPEKQNRCQKCEKEQGKGSPVCVCFGRSNQNASTAADEWDQRESCETQCVEDCVEKCRDDQTCGEICVSLNSPENLCG